MATSDPFPTLRRSAAIYLDAAGRSPLPAVAAVAGTAGLLRKAQTPWSIGDTDADADAVRMLFAEVIGARADEICFAPSCAYAMSLAATNLRGRITRARPFVLVLQDQHFSSVLPWQHACAERGGELRIIRRPPDDDWTSSLLAALRERTAAVCCAPPSHWTDGSIIDLKAVSEACGSSATALVVDGTQWIGAGEEPPSDDLGDDLGDDLNEYLGRWRAQREGGEGRRDRVLGAQVAPWAVR